MTGQKLLYIINHMDWFWSHRLPLAEAAKNRDWDVLIAAPGADRDLKLKDYGFTGINISSNPWCIYKVIAQHKPTLVHAITLKQAFFTGLAAWIFPNIRVVHTIAGLGYLFSDEGFFLRLLLSPFLKLAFKAPHTKIIFQNPDDQKIFIERGFARAEQCHLIRGSGVDTEKFAPRPGTEDDPPLVLMPTRLVRDKGVGVFIEAARILKARGVNARFAIAGGLSPSNPQGLTESDMRILTADGSVEWLGKVEDMPGLLARATLIVYPSYYREGVPKVLLEAAAMRIAIITTNHPGCREVVAHNDNGLLVPIKNPQETAVAIEELLNDPKRRHTMGEHGRARATNEFDVRLVVAETLKIYS